MVGWGRVEDVVLSCTNGATSVEVGLERLAGIDVKVGGVAFSCIWYG